MWAAHNNLTRLAASLCFLLVNFLPATAQSSPCPPPKALLQKSDPVYADAMDLAETLRTKGFEFACMFPSKSGSMFMIAKGDTFVSTIEGEVAYVTKQGSGFDAFFLPKPQTFSQLGVHRLRSGQGYLYTFSGTPPVWATNRLGSASRQYFFKRENFLLISEETMRDRLQQALGVKAESP